MRVHRNLHKACWSLTVRGERVKHVDSFALRSVRFVVSKAGHKRVVERKCRMVHAWADGVATSETDTAGLVQVTYNPFRCGSFIRCDTGEPVATAELVVFTADGRAMAKL